MKKLIKSVENVHPGRYDLLMRMNRGSWVKMWQLPYHYQRINLILLNEPPPAVLGGGFFINFI